MTCKDSCVHYCVCKDTVSDDNWPDDAAFEIKYMFSPEGCENFKPVSDYKKIQYGQWKLCSKNMFGRDYRCSICSGLAPLNRRGHYEQLTRYCPECGAEMIVEAQNGKVEETKADH